MDFSRSDGGVLIEEVSGIMLDLNRPNHPAGVCSRGHHGAVMSAVGLGPESELASLICAELRVGKEYLQELDTEQGRFTVKSTKEWDLCE